MQKLASTWLLASVVIAVVLWLLATMLENRLRVPDEAPPISDTAEEQRVEDSPFDGAARGSMSCEDSESKLKLIIDDARSCNDDDDCTLFDYGYPMDCMTSVAKSKVPLLREEYRQYDETCEFRVFYDCPTQPYVRLALCRNNRCTVELDKRDDLQDESLDHTGGRKPD